MWTGNASHLVQDDAPRNRPIDFTCRPKFDDDIMLLLPTRTWRSPSVTFRLLFDFTFLKNNLVINFSTPSRTP